MSKLDYADDYYRKHYERWKYAMDHYDGTYAIPEEQNGRLSEYLKQKYQRENNKAYEERRTISDPVLHFGTIVDSINGVLSSKQDETVREFGSLGDPNKKGSYAEQLWYNADGDGTNWEPFFKKVGIKLTVMHEVWGYVQGVTDTSEPCVKLISPSSVINRYPSKGEPTQVLICEKMDIRTSMDDDKGMQDVYTLFTLDGWEQYYYNDGVKVLHDSGEYAFYADYTQRRRTLPIFRTVIPMPRPVGYLLALKENHIYNQKSVRDFAIRNMSYAILSVGVSNDADYQGITKSLEKGANILAQLAGNPDHKFISPPSQYLSDAQKILERDVEDFYVNAFKKYGEAARQVTATQIKLESQSGIESFLNLLVNSIDEFENAALWRLEQVYFPKEPSQWGNAMVKRSTKFQPEEMPNISELAKVAVDLDRAQVASRRTMVQMLHPTWDDAEVDAEIDRINSEKGAAPINPMMIE